MSSISPVYPSRIVLDNLAVSLQPTAETCWSSVVSAVGNRGKKADEKQLAPISLIVAEHIRPSKPLSAEQQKEFDDSVTALKASGIDYDVKANFEQRLADYQKKQATNPKQEASRPIPTEADETRKAVDMLRKHFNIDAEQTNVKDQKDDARKRIRTSLQKGLPVMLSIAPTVPLLYIDGGDKPKNTEKKFEHVLLCYGGVDLNTDTFTVLYRDPAIPAANEREVTIDNLVDGFVYLKLSEGGPNFKRNFGDRAVNMKLVHIVVQK